MRYSRMVDSYPPPVRTASKSKYATALIVIIFIGIAAYLLSAGVVGNWVAHNVITPVLSAFNGKSDGTNAVATETAPPAKSTPRPTTEPSSMDIDIEGFTVYCVQLGAFSDGANADAESGALKQRGAAGYILNDGALHRVFAAAFDTEDQARAVKTQLLETEELDSSIYTLEAKTLNMKITANEDRIEVIKEAFDRYIAAKDELGSLSISYDKKETGFEDCKIKLSEISKDLSDISAQISEIPSDEDENDMLKKLADLLDNGSQELSDLTASGYKDDAAFSSALKYAYIDLSEQYASFIKTITTSD